MPKKQAEERPTPTTSYRDSLEIIGANGRRLYVTRDRTSKVTKIHVHEIGDHAVLFTDEGLALVAEALRKLPRRRG
jgi:hypothetical protein